MGLKGVTGNASNKAVLHAAYCTHNSLIIDCANVADPFQFISDVPAEEFETSFVIGFDMIYSLPDVLKSVPGWCSSKNCKSVFVTSFSRLFHYQDNDENSDVWMYAWELLASLSTRYDVLVSVDKRQLALAKRFCNEIVGAENMGHTVSSQRMVVERMASELEAFARALRAEDKEAFRHLLSIPRSKLAPINNASSLHAWAFMLLTILVEQEKRLAQVESCVAG